MEGSPAISPRPLLNAGFVYGHTAAMQTLNGVMTEIAHTKIPVLLVGESGTGKEVYARLIHRLSRFSEQPLKKVICGAVSTSKILNQVYDPTHVGENAASRGSLFLDGVEELDLACQRVLLSLLPDGDSESEQLAARLISSTTKDLEREISAGRFRRELYFRLNGVCLRLLPLRERIEDIPTLMDFFLQKYAGELKKALTRVDAEAMEFLTRYAWPGNIRELGNVARKMVVLGDCSLALRDMQVASVRIPVVAETLRSSSLKVEARAAARLRERELILEALERTKWNRKRAAQELQISYKSLLYKMKQIGTVGNKSEG